MPISQQLFTAYTILIWSIGWISNSIIVKINNRYKKQQIQKEMQERFDRGKFIYPKQSINYNEILKNYNK